MVTACFSVLDDIKERYSCNNDTCQRMHAKTYCSNIDLKSYEKHTPIESITRYISLLDRLQSKYSVPKVSECFDDRQLIGDKIKTELLRFDEDEDENRKRFYVIYNNAKELRRKYYNVLSNSDENTVYFKTADKLVSRIERFIDKGNFLSHKVSDEIVKILSLTIMKNFAKSELFSLIDNFMLECKFGKKELQIGKKVEDDDFDYIGENYLKIEVPSLVQHNTIIKKQHDAYIFDCYDPDEEELFQKIIPGDYAIGYRKE